MAEQRPSAAMPTIRAVPCAVDSARVQDVHLQAGVLAHDFNNLMGVILGATEKLAAVADPASPEHQLARVALEAAERGAEMLKRLLALGHGQAPTAAPVDCAAQIPGIVRFARQIVPQRVEVWISNAAQGLFFLGDSAALEAAVLNLCANAGHAMPEGGLLTLDVRSTDLHGPRAAQLGLAPGAYVKVTVSDTGVGMSPAVLARASEPLFTTRAGDGSGLGLSSVRDFALGAGGAFQLQSVEGEGSVATLYLPQAFEEAEAIAYAA